MCSYRNVYKRNIKYFHNAEMTNKMVKVLNEKTPVQVTVEYNDRQGGIPAWLIISMDDIEIIWENYGTEERAQEFCHDMGFEVVTMKNQQQKYNYYGKDSRKFQENQVFYKHDNTEHLFISKLQEPCPA